MTTIKTNFILGILRYFLFDKIELQDGYIIRQWKWLGLFNGNREAFKADRAVFCDEGNGVFGKSIFFGSIDKTVEDHREIITVAGKSCDNMNGMDIFGLKKNDRDAIQQYLIDNGAKLSDNDAVEYFSKFPVFKPLRWFMPRESLRLGKEGIFHKVKTITRTRNSYIPYEDLKVFSGWGLFGKRLAILGDVTVVTRERFLKNVYIELKELVGKRSKVLSAEGKMYRPALLSFKKRNKYILLLNEGVIARNKTKMYYFDYNDIENYGFDKKHWWSLFGEFWCVASREDARTTSFTQFWWSDTVHEFEVPGIPFWRWRYLLFFRGSLKKKLKKNCKRAKKQNRKIIKEARKQDRKMYKDELKGEMTNAKGAEKEIINNN
ncbi:MAG: hypothetical protein K6E93_05855 [Bacteroidales bacterium]|nr:hypothetical protein [Bacteroidales bacterium]